MFEKLTDMFSAVGVKYLTAVDTNPQKSNQHEIGGLVKAGIGDKLGRPDDGSRLRFKVTMVYMTDFDDEPIVVEDKVTWYDSRYHDSTRGPEWRLYYFQNLVTEAFCETDFMLIALSHDGELLMLFCPQGSESEVQLRAIFGATDIVTTGQMKPVEIEKSSIHAPIRLLLARYGIHLDKARQDDDELGKRVVEKFNGVFPTTKLFSKFARDISIGVSAIEDPDAAIIQWMESEERIFRLLERHIVKQHLVQGFDDVDEFIKVSLSVQNRRKARAGAAFENHIEAVLQCNGVKYERGVNTEGKSRPDFLFPGRAAYIDPVFPASKLRILGAKTSCKERWRQVLAEADRIQQKHLITLEPAVSEDQTEEMKFRELQLVVPTAVQSTYKPEQQEWLISFKEFIENIPR